MTTFFSSVKNLRPALTLLGLGLGTGLAGCQVDIAEPAAATAGNANVATYIAVGNSLTAGYQSGGLSRAGQLQSYPAILARQFAQVGGGAFNQPLFDQAYASGSGYLRLAAITNGAPVTAPVTDSLAVISGSLRTGTNLLRKYAGTDNQNLGVPGIRVADVTTVGYGLNNPVGYNPFFERLLAGSSPATYLQYVQERVATLKPTFFTNWLGNNDVLLYAVAGGVSTASAPTALTSVADFTTKYKQVLDALTTTTGGAPGGAKGALATIPNVTNVPLFTTLKASTLKALIRSNPTLPNASSASLYITTGANVVREATDNDYILLTAQAVVGTGATATNPFPIGVGYSAAQSNPLPSQFVLDADEATAVLTRTSELNNVIRTEATNRGLALFDANVYFQGVATNGVATNAVNNTTGFITGNLFSLDGVHPTARGYALIANEFIKAINNRYGATIRTVDANRYRPVLLPN
jgi:lysophospholipase L1-like esterase